MATRGASLGVPAPDPMSSRPGLAGAEGAGTGSLSCRFVFLGACVERGGEGATGDRDHGFAASPLTIASPPPSPQWTLETS